MRDYLDVRSDASLSRVLPDRPRYRIGQLRRLASPCCLGNGHHKLSVRYLDVPGLTGNPLDDMFSAGSFIFLTYQTSQAHSLFFCVFCYCSFISCEYFSFLSFKNYFHLSNFCVNFNSERFCVQPPVSAFAAARRAAAPCCCAAGRYLLPAGPTAANPPHAAAAGEWNRQMADGRRAVI